MFFGLRRSVVGVCTYTVGERTARALFTGMINGYFDNNLPCNFFDLLSYYYACNALSARCYTFLGTEPYEPEEGIQHMENIVRWFDDMRNPVPTWYLKDFYIQWIDGVPYKLKAPFGFSFLSTYGWDFVKERVPIRYMMLRNAPSVTSAASGSSRLCSLL